jgi:hexosaminidase
MMHKSSNSKLLLFGLLILNLLAFLSSCTSHKHVDISIIPQPESIETSPGSFSFNENTLIILDASDDAQRIGQELGEFMEKQFAIKLKSGQENRLSNTIQLVNSNSNEKEGSYNLRITKKRIVIEASTYQGIFYGIQTLKQMLSPQIKIKKPVLQCAVITDEPRFKWRGMMLDVSRHFFPKDSVKKIIDVLAMHKMNKFHWHLVDGIGWRIEIKKFPELTNRGAWRKVKEGKKPWEDYESTYQNPVENIYGGYYSQDDIREVVAYAAQNYIDVIPEIEMPGHSTAALQCFPELVCKGGNDTSVYCAGNDKSFEFLQDIISEVTQLFPYEYIHVGGDEVGKDNWMECSLCQKRMKAEGLQNADELQSYFVEQMEAFIHAKNKKLIGWDEILEGGLPARASLMSWRGMQGGIEAANKGHDVVMSPGSPCYFDHNQGRSEFEPPSWGGYNNLLKVYDFDPIPEDIRPDKVMHILGGQANLWTEQIPTLVHAQYMLLPRLCALSEALWTKQSQKNQEWFIQKIDVHFDRLSELKYNYAYSSLSPDYKTEYDNNSKSFFLSLSNELGLHEIRYTLDGSTPTMRSPLYKEKIQYATPIVLNAQCFRNGVAIGYPIVKHLSTQFAAKCKVEYKYPYSESYSGGGDRALFDSQFATNRGDDKYWQGIKQNDFDVTIDLGETTTLSQISLHFFQHISATSVMLPTKVTMHVSMDGLNYIEMYNERLKTVEDRDPIIRLVKANFENQKVRWIKIVATNRGTLPPEHIRQGDAWLFVDEISIK